MDYLKSRFSSSMLLITYLEVSIVAVALCDTFLAAKSDYFTFKLIRSSCANSFFEKARFSGDVILDGDRYLYPSTSLLLFSSVLLLVS